MLQFMAVVADLAIGESPPEQAMRSDTIYQWLSSGKPITSVALAILHERGHLNWDDPVAIHLPEFVDGKTITIRHFSTTPVVFPRSILDGTIAHGHRSSMTSVEQGLNFRLVRGPNSSSIPTATVPRQFRMDLGGMLQSWHMVTEVPSRPARLQIRHTVWWSRGLRMSE